MNGTGPVFFSVIVMYGAASAPLERRRSCAIGVLGQHPEEQRVAIAADRIGARDHTREWMPRTDDGLQHAFTHLGATQATDQRRST